MKKHIKIIGMQVIFLVLVLAALYFLYPKADVKVDGNLVNFNSINAKVIMISENPDFSNPRYLDFSRRKMISVDLNPGTYYWKADNGIIESLKNEFTIGSEIGMKINRDEESELENIGNVKINVTKTDDGIMVGHIILEPDEGEEVEDEEGIGYTGREE